MYSTGNQMTNNQKIISENPIKDTYGFCTEKETLLVSICNSKSTANNPEKRYRIMIKSYGEKNLPPSADNPDKNNKPTA